MDCIERICACRCHQARETPRAPSLGANAIPLETLDFEIQRLSQALHKLSACRNSLLPVNRLPPEMLQRIFAFVVAPGSLIDRAASHLATSFAEVCHYWRGVALASADLWTCPPFSRPHLASAALERSKIMPLDVRARFPMKKPDHALNGVLEIHCTRIQSLRMYISDSSYIDGRLKSLLQGPLLALRNLGLELARTEQESDGEVELPEDALLSLAPRLQKLMLRGGVSENQCGAETARKLDMAGT